MVVLPYYIYNKYIHIEKKNADMNHSEIKLNKKIVIRQLFDIIPIITVHYIIFNTNIKMK